MYVKKISVGKAIPTTATSAVSTTVDLTTDPQLFPFSQGGSSLVAFSFNAAAHGAGSVSLLTATDGTTFSVATDMAGAAVTVTLPDTAAFAGVVKYFTVKSLGQAVKIKVTGTATGGAGTVDCNLVQE
jgi:hypothetical protein